jgi:hypothetical protein
MGQGGVKVNIEKQDGAQIRFYEYAGGLVDTSGVCNATAG